MLVVSQVITEGRKVGAKILATKITNIDGPLGRNLGEENGLEGLQDVHGRCCKVPVVTYMVGAERPAQRE